MLVKSQQSFQNYSRTQGLGHMSDLPKLNEFLSLRFKKGNCSWSISEAEFTHGWFPYGPRASVAHSCVCPVNLQYLVQLLQGMGNQEWGFDRAPRRGNALKTSRRHSGYLSSWRSDEKIAPQILSRPCNWKAMFYLCSSVVCWCNHSNSVTDCSWNLAKNQ